MFVLVSSVFFLFGSVRQTKLATRQLLGHVNIVSPSYRVVSYRIRRHPPQSPVYTTPGVPPRSMEASFGVRSHAPASSVHRLPGSPTALEQTDNTCRLIARLSVYSSGHHLVRYSRYTVAPQVASVVAPSRESREHFASNTFTARLDRLFWSAYCSKGKR